jgi:hypothetical protein
MGQSTSRKGQGLASRIYYGHAFQLPEGRGATHTTGTTVALAHDPFALNATSPHAIPPWYRGVPVGMINTRFAPPSDPLPVYSAAGAAGSVNGNQPEPRQWLLVRQPVLLVDDDVAIASHNSKTLYLEEVITARSIFWQAAPGGQWGFSREVRNGRVDAAASDLSEIKRFIQTGAAASGTGVSAWPAQRDRIFDAVYYPRAERKAPSMHRVDQALTNHVISGACSSFIVEWTYEDETGHVNSLNPGVQHFTDIEQPWFGYADPGRGVQPLTTTFPDPKPIVPTAIESFTNPVPGVFMYNAFFGYNQTQPFNPSTNAPWGPGDVTAYTPFPSALRITMTLHDPEGKLEGGRQFQFVINLPKQ